MKEIIDRLKNRFPISDICFQRSDEAFVSIDKEFAVELITHLKDYEGYLHLCFLTAVDWPEAGNFQLTYLLSNPTTKKMMGIRVELPRENPVMTSTHHLWKTMGTYQRELKEMFGIEFPGSPRLDEPFFLEGWEDIPPLRRDFDSKKYSDETYFPRPGRKTYDPAEHMKQKLYPEELQ